MHEIDNLPWPRDLNVCPAGPTTGVSNPRCYLGFTEDCSSDLSREHYVSKVLLEQYQNLTISGMPWQKAGERQRIGPNALTSWILCTRHNNALSPLDTAAGASFSQLGAALAHATKRSVSKQTGYFYIDGNALERWGLKTLLGIYYAEIARTGGEKVAARLTLSEEVTRRVLLEGHLTAPQGMYAGGLPLGEVFDHSLNMAPLTNEREGVVSGLLLRNRGWEFTFIFDLSGLPKVSNLATGMTRYRPWILDLVGRARTARVIIGWRGNRDKPQRLAMSVDDWTPLPNL